MFYFYYTAFFAKIKCFLQKIEKMFDFLSDVRMQKAILDAYKL